MIQIHYSNFGKKLTGTSGIGLLMDDIGKPLPSGLEPCLFGGGNPARIPQVEKMYRTRMEEILQNGDEFERLIGCYDSPQGKTSFVNDVAAFLATAYGWKIGPENIAVTNGSQSAFFYLFNMFGGTSGTGKNIRKMKILFPLVPEYTGYADQGAEDGIFVSIPSDFKFFGNHTFKYSVNFDLLERFMKAHHDIGALCVTRPTNPTGNVLTNEEIHHLARLAAGYQIPLFIDNAYGLPWPDIVFTSDPEPYWDENVVLSLSLSKIGLPALRTGIIVADTRIIKALSNINAVAALAPGSIGPALSGSLLRRGILTETARTAVRPYYRKKSEFTQQLVHNFFAGGDYAVHTSEGAIFLWILMKDLTITTMELYRILKERGVFIMPGEFFFFGTAEDSSLPPVEQHPHYSKCIRFNYARPDEEIERGIKIIAGIYKNNRK
jgi:valine--pyruvate aminotransferase